MPENGCEQLKKLNEVVVSYAIDEYEIKAFEVEINGKHYMTVPGTGNSVGTGAIIDFGDDKWWGS